MKQHTQVWKKHTIRENLEKSRTARSCRGDFRRFERFVGDVEVGERRLKLDVRIQRLKQKHLQMSQSAQTMAHRFLWSRNDGKVNLIKEGEMMKA